MYDNLESKYKKDMKTTIEYIGSTGICDFECWDCEINAKCEEYNHRENDSIDVDQKNFRMKTAREYIMRNKKC